VLVPFLFPKNLIKHITKHLYVLIYLGSTIVGMKKVMGANFLDDNGAGLAKPKQTLIKINPKHFQKVATEFNK